MADLPEQALQDATEALSRMLFSGQPAYGTWMEHDEDLARAAVEAAAPLLAEHIASLLAAEKVPCKDHPDPGLPRPSCWTCGRNGMVHRLARIAREAFPKGGDDDS